MSAVLPIAALFAHYVGDFVVQTSWMAMNKSKSMKALGLHIGAYSLCLLPFGPVYAVANGAIHLGVDYVTSRVNARNWEAKRIKQFWLGVGFDQFLHAGTLLATLPLAWSAP